MPRQARLRIAGLPLHIVQRGVNRMPIFLADADRHLYLSLLEELSAPHACAVHAYVLMTNHVHLLLTPGAAPGASLLMKHLGQRFAQHVNRTYRRTGGLFEDRFRSSIVDSEAYFLRCQRYIELNPVRAGMVAHPADYAWSSYRVNAQGEESSLVTPHREYLALGPDVGSRCRHYRDLFAQALTGADLERIRTAANAGMVLGSDRFIEAFERCFGRKAAKRTRGKDRLPRGGVSPLSVKEGSVPD